MGDSGIWEKLNQPLGPQTVTHALCMFKYVSSAQLTLFYLV